MKEWGYENDKLIFDESDPNNHVEYFVPAIGEIHKFAIGIYLSVPIANAKLNCNHTSFCIRLTSYKNESFIELIGNTEFTWYDKTFTANTKLNGADILHIMISASSITRLQLTNLPSLLYLIVLTNYPTHYTTSTILRILRINVFSNNDNLRYALIDQPIDMRTRVSRESVSSSVVQFRGLVENDKQLHRSIFLDFENLVDIFSMYYNCQNLEMNQIPGIENGILKLGTSISTSDMIYLEKTFYKFGKMLDNLKFRIGPSAKLALGSAFRYTKIQRSPEFIFDSDDTTVNFNSSFSNLDVFNIDITKDPVFELINRAYTMAGTFSFIKNLNISNLPANNEANVIIPKSTICSTMFQYSNITTDCILQINAPQCTSVSEMFDSGTLPQLPSLNVPECTTVYKTFEGCRVSKIYDTILLKSVINAPKATNANRVFFRFRAKVTTLDMQDALPMADAFLDGFGDSSAFTNLINCNWINVKNLSRAFRNTFIKRIDNPHTMGNVTNFESMCAKSKISNLFTLGDPDPTHIIDLSSATNVRYMFLDTLFDSVYDVGDEPMLVLPEKITIAEGMLKNTNITRIMIDVLGQTNLVEFIANENSPNLLNFHIRFSKKYKYTSAMVNHLCYGHVQSATHSIIRIFNPGSLDPSIDFNTLGIHGCRALYVGGYINRCVSNLVEAFDIYDVVNLHIFDAYVEAGTILIDVPNIVHQNQNSQIDICLTPIHYTDGTLVPPEKYKDFFNWGDFSGTGANEFNNIYIYLFDRTGSDWSDSYWSSIPSGVGMSAPSDKFGTSSSSFQPHCAKIDHSAIGWLDWPAEWLTDLA